ncbi:MAG: hypothetical protein A2218_04975 [Elusimicrobia bacterium RIFOXYA2_FULL_53_38]|nr:MAG: hypothetical protein A2218_04975 [Elusimicrobia bacterium RIFOXYA2_FULL_53_38]
MRNKIGTVILGVASLFICAGFGIAGDGELLAFDKVYESPLLAVNSNAKKVALPVASQEIARQESSDTHVSQQNDRLLVMKDWLKNVPSADRAEFLGGLVVLDGEVVSIYTAPLKRTMSRGGMDKILAGFDSPAGAAKATSPKKQKSFSPLIKLSELLKDVPAAVRTEFLEKMVLKNGAIVSMYTGGLKKALPTSKMIDILNSLEPVESESQKHPKTLCGNGECYEAICSGEPGHRYCIDQKEYKCTTKCYSIK